MPNAIFDSGKKIALSKICLSQMFGLCNMHCANFYFIRAIFWLLSSKNWSNKKKQTQSCLLNWRHCLGLNTSDSDGHLLTNISRVFYRVSCRDIHIECSKQFKWNSHFHVSGQSGPFWAVLKMLYNSNRLTHILVLTYTIQCTGQDISLKSARKNPWFNILLTTQSFVCATV